MILNDVKTIADNIDDFIEVPDGVNRLRKAILTLAVSGKLVPQDKKEGTGKELYNQIKLEYKNKKNNAKELLRINEEEIPFDIPKSWKWIRLGEITKVQTGNLDANAANINGKYPFFTCAKEPLKIDRFAYDCECVLLAGNGDFNVKYYNGKFEAYQRTYIIEAVNEKIFVPYIYIITQIQAEKYKKTFLGSAMPYIKLGYVTEAIIPLPPLTEQKRIVKKVEEVMKKLDELEIKKNERNETRNRLTRSAMQSLGKGESKIALKQLAELVKTPKDIKELEDAILSLAVSGKLVAQDKKEGTGEELFSEIQKEFKEKINRRRQKKEIVETISSEEIQFSIPKSWKWIRLGSCMNIFSGDSLSVKEAKEGKYLVYGGNGIAGRHSAYNTVKGTIVIGRVGALCGIAHIVESDAWVTDNAFIVEYPEKLINKNYFTLTLNHLNLRSSHRGSAQPVISGISVYPIIMPLPPLAEQKRIVKKVDEIMVLVNQIRDIVGDNKTGSKGRPNK